MSMEVSRRDMLKGGAVLAAGLAATAGVSVLGCATAQDDAALADTSAKWDYEADVVVVGAGMAGFFASMAAADEGSSVILIEKAPENEAGGDSRCFGGNFVGRWAHTGYEYSDDFGNEVVSVAEDIVDFMHDIPTLEWRTESICEGAGFKAYTEVLNIVNGYDNIQLLYSTPAKKLLKDADDSAVVGVVAEQDGSPVKIRANKGVVLATGGYASNRDLFNRFQFPHMELFSVTSPHVTGDGLLMAMEAGGAVRHIGQSAEWFDFAYAVPSRELGTGITSRLSSSYDSTSYGNSNPSVVNSRIFVDMDGERFMDELEYITHSKRNDLAFMELLDPDGGEGARAKYYHHLPFFMVCDQSCIDSAPLGIVPDDCNWEWSHVQGIYEWSSDNSKEVEAGWFIKADTIEELAAKMTAKSNITGETLSMNAEGLKATVENYNANCAKGSDDFRPAETLVALSDPPFYAIEMAPCLVYNTGGVSTNENGQVLDWNDEPISGLFAAGEIGMGAGSAGSIGVAGCGARGRIAGEYVATLESRELEA